MCGRRRSWSLLVLSATFVSCLKRQPATKPPAEHVETETPSGPAEQPREEREANVPEKGKLAILLLGFYNNEKRDAFKPDSIVYASVNPKEAHSQLVAAARGLDDNPRVVLSWSETDALADRVSSSEEMDLVGTRIQSALSVLDAYANGAQDARSREKQLQAAFPPSAKWGANDRIVEVLGLETVVRRSRSRGLSSVLGCFWFSGAGSYLGGVVEPYDFSHFSTRDMVHLVTTDVSVRPSQDALGAVR